MAELTPQPVLDRMAASMNQQDDPRRGLLKKLNERRKQGLDARRPYEPVWHLSQSFVANRQWVGWSPGGNGRGRVVTMPNPGDRERHTENVVTQYLQTVLGKLYADDFMPTLRFRREDIESEDFADHSNKALKWAWDEELIADEIIREGLLKMGVFGTAGLRCYWDPGRGPVIGELPVDPGTGEPIYNMEQAHQMVAQAQQAGEQLEFRPVREGRIVWETLSPFNIVGPPGVDHERNFPWLIIERPVPIDYIKLRYGDVPGLREMDLMDYDQSGLRDAPALEQDGVGGGHGPNKLKQHAILSTMYEQPCPDYPQGMTAIWSDQTLLHVEQRLPYELNGEPHNGCVFFKYHTIPGRFWAVGIVEPLIGPQRQRNRARSQQIEMKDRNLGRIYAHKGTVSVSNLPKGKIMELIEVPLGHDFPQETSGVPPGPWIENEARINDEAMDRISGLREVSMGQAPAGVSAYSAMALLAEQDDRRMGPILKDIRTKIAVSVKLTLYDIRRYWGPEKQIALAGPAGMIEHFIYSASKLPDMVYVEVPPGAARPRSPAAEIQKIFDLFDRSVSSGRPLPLEWLYESLEQGQPMPIPKSHEEVQRQKAQLEGMLMASQPGSIIPPDYYDDNFIHVAVHREAQIEAAGSGQVEQAQALEYHIQLHMEAEKMKQVGVSGPGQAGGTPSGSSVPQQQGPQGGLRPNSGM